MDTPIRILHLISDLHTGGAQSMLYKIMTGMDTSQFHNIAVSLTGKGLMGERLSARGIPVHYLEMRRGVPNPNGLMRLIRIIRREQPDIIQTWLYHADLLGFLANTITRRPILLWNVRQSLIDFHRYSRLTRLVVQVLARLSRFPNAVLVNSLTGQRDHIELGYSPKRWVYIPNGFDLTTFSPQTGLSLREMLGIPPDTFLIGMFARYDPMKDYQTFLQAADQLDYPHVHFVLGGPNVEQSNKELMSLVKKDTIHLIGDRDDVHKLLPGLDLYTSSSAFGEGFSNSIGEAMASGIPCVATDVGDAAVIIDNTGIIIPPRNPDALANAWRKMIEMPLESRAHLGAAARLRMEQHYSIRQIVQQYERLYIDLISRAT